MKKLTISTISIILALCMLVLSMTACKNTASYNNNHKAPITWYRNTTVINGKFLHDKYFGDTMPKDFFDCIYNYRESEKYYINLTVSIYPKYEITFDDMSDDFKEAYWEHINEYWDFEQSDNKDKENSKKCLVSKATIEVSEKTENFFNSLNFNSIIQPDFSYGWSVIDYSGTLTNKNIIVFRFTDHFSENSEFGNTPTLEDFIKWEWNDIDKLAELEWIEKIHVEINISGYDCT